MASPADAIVKFVDVTGVDEERAKFYLEATSYDLNSALQHFFEEHTAEGADSDIEEIPAPTVNTDPTAQGGAKPKPTNSRFQTVASLKRDSSSDDDEGAQAFFAGGSIHSGQQVLGPGRSRNQIVADMFRSVREHGGEVVNQEAGGKPNTLKFSGAGYRLGQTEDDSQVVNAATASGRQQQQTARESHEVTITLKMWRQGFSIDEGPLRQYSDPANQEFLKTVSSGVIPDELLREARGHEVHLNLEDHSHEAYVNVKPKLKAFSGKGNVLGSPVPGNVVPAPPLPSTSANPAMDIAKARAAVPVDESSPTTTIPIRLADGSRLVATFNHSHTIGDIRNYIITARPEYSTQPFFLRTSFPSKELTDNSETLAAAGAINAAILQRLGR